MKNIFSALTVAMVYFLTGCMVEPTGFEPEVADYSEEEPDPPPTLPSPPTATHPGVRLLLDTNPERHHDHTQGSIAYKDKIYYISGKNNKFYSYDPVTEELSRVARNSNYDSMPRPIIIFEDKIILKKAVGNHTKLAYYDEVTDAIYFTSNAMTGDQPQHIVCKNKLLLQAYDGLYQYHLSSNQLSRVLVRSGVRSLHCINDKLYYIYLDDGKTKNAVWDFENTPDDIDGTLPLSHAVVFQDDFFFSGYNADFELVLVRYDPAIFEYEYYDIRREHDSSNFSILVEFDGKLYLKGFNDQGWHLFYYDPANNTVEHAETLAHSAYHLNLPVIFDGRIFFERASINGTSTGTEMVFYEPGHGLTIVDINPGSEPSHASYFTVIGDKLHFRAVTGGVDDQDAYEIGNYIYDGPSDTYKHIEGNSVPLDGRVDNLFLHDGSLFFSGFTNSNGRELMRWHIEEQTLVDLTKDDYPSLTGFFPRKYTALGERLFVKGRTGVKYSYNKYQYGWYEVDIAGNTLSQVATDGSSSSNYDYMQADIALGDRIFFEGHYYRPIPGRIYYFDVATGTTDIITESNRDMIGLSMYNNNLYAVSASENYPAFYEIDGTSLTITDHSTILNSYGDMGIIGNQAYITDHRSIVRRNLDTHEEIELVHSGQVIEDLLVINDRLYFVGHRLIDGANDHQIFEVNTTTGELTQITSLPAIIGGGKIRDVVKMNSALYFSATTINGVRELFKADLTTNTSFQVTFLSEHEVDADVIELTPDPANDVLYFIASTRGYGREIYKFDNRIPAEE